MRLSTVTAALVAVPTLALADTPAFDRPGIAFSPTTLPAGTLSWEQGLPDVVHVHDDGSSQTLYSADSVLRAGLMPNLELQLSWAPFNHLHSSDHGSTTNTNGSGDPGIALKVALPDPAAQWTWAALAGLSVPGSNASFSNSHALYTLASTAQYTRSDAQSVSLYAEIDAIDSRFATVLSPSLTFSINDRYGAFVEAGYTHAEHAGDDLVAGGGLTMLAASNVQLDVYADAGLTTRSTALQAGFGVSVYLP